MKSAQYYSDAAAPGRRLSVLSENADKTVQLGEDAGEGKMILVVGKCPVSDVPKTGHCVVEKVAPANPKVPVVPPKPPVVAPVVPPASTEATASA